MVLLALLHVVVAEGLADTAYLDARTTGSTTSAAPSPGGGPSARRPCAGARGTAAARRPAARGGVARPRGAGAYVLTGRGVEQSSQGTATVTAAIDLALALGLPGRVGSGYGAITGQGTVRADASTGRRRTSSPGTAGSTTRRPARTSPRCGVSTRRRSPAPGCPPSSSCGRSGRGPDRAVRPRPTPRTGARAPCSCTGRTSWSARRTRTGSRPTCARSTCSWCATSCRRRRRCSRTSCCP